ncbi:contactin-5-like [Xenia sp. Carnegie-2017]|uniref:contactin-5-like n=1 Tax=Xenia sp. Carnegie-2017 TaxID=2897299 RepID=UPI001F03AC51|nr:contactin-5-like [Xenia sp. Carnegie-2017]XP_046839550.1 contactin-5-like [Xenia sp. Carnegie-2017]
MNGMDLRLYLIFFAAVEATSLEFSENAPENYTGLAENFRNLECNIKGAKTYEWFHNDTKIPSDGNKFYLFTNKLVVLQSTATADYQGTYQCLATSDDEVLRGPKIKVRFPPVDGFYKTDSEVEEALVTVGKDFALTCPPRKLSRDVFFHWGGRRGTTGAWFLTSAKHYMIMENGTLLFANVRKKDLEVFNVEKNGVSCVIESKEYKNLAFSQRFLLREISGGNKTPFGPMIRTELKDKRVSPGKSIVVLRCGAVGLPTPDYTWTFTNLEGRETTIVSGGRDGYELQNFNHLLMITSIDIKHAGLYKCKVNSTYNGKDHVDERMARLDVIGRPIWLEGGQLANETIKEGQNFSWSCNAYSYPAPTYSWTKNGMELSESNNLEIQDGKLYFQLISKADEGVYKCLVGNNLGLLSSSANLSVETGTGESGPAITLLHLCVREKRNIFFLVDGSGSVSTTTFENFKKFMSLVVESFDIGPNTTHVGLLQYSSKSHTGLEFYFTEYQTAGELTDAISKVEFHYGAYTFGGYAMDLAQQIMNHYNRADAKNAWVLLMDDGVWDKAIARNISLEVRQSGSKIIVLDTKAIMYDIADMGLMFTSDDLEDNAQKVVEEICK